MTASGRLDPDLRVFSAPVEPPLVLTSELADPAALHAIENLGDIHRLPGGQLTVDAITSTLASLGLRRALLEGGPRLNQQVLAAGALDEVFVTIAPTLVGGEVRRILSGDDEAATPLELISAYEHGGDLLLRYRIRR